MINQNGVQKTRAPTLEHVIIFIIQTTTPMATYCFVYGCKSVSLSKKSQGSKCHFFHPPKNDPDLFSKWEQMCFRQDRKLTVNHRVCQEHFPVNLLVTAIEVPLNDGTVLRSSLEHWRLKPGSFPSLCLGNAPDRFVENSPNVGLKYEPCMEDGAVQLETEIVHTTPLLDVKSCEGTIFTVSIGTQTRLTGSKWFAMQQTWKRKYFKLKKSVAKQKARKLSGVFLAFHKLSALERKIAVALARKSPVKPLKGLRCSDLGADKPLTLSCHVRGCVT